MSWLRLLLIVLILAPVVRVGPTPACCQPQAACCDGGQQRDCCDRELSLELNRGWDRGLTSAPEQVPAPALAATLPETAALAPIATAVLPLPQGPWVTGRPPPVHLATTILRL